MVDSFKKRYFYKLFSNLITLVIGMVTVGIAPRALGPLNYGNFTFLNNFFKPMMPFITFNSSLAYLTKLSKRPNEKKLSIFYFYIVK